MFMQLPKSRTAVGIVLIQASGAGDHGAAGPHPGNDALARQLQKKLALSLVMLLSTEPEIHFVALHNVNLILQKAPQILSHEVKVRNHPTSMQ